MELCTQEAVRKQQLFIRCFALDPGTKPPDNDRLECSVRRFPSRSCATGLLHRFDSHHFVVRRQHPGSGRIRATRVSAFQRRGTPRDMSMSGKTKRILSRLLGSRCSRRPDEAPRTSQPRGQPHGETSCNHARHVRQGQKSNARVIVTTQHVKCSTSWRRVAPHSMLHVFLRLFFQSDLRGDFMSESLSPFKNMSVTWLDRATTSGGSTCDVYTCAHQCHVYLASCQDVRVGKRTKRGHYPSE